MYGPNGLRASELAARLVELIEQHGDCRVVVDSNEYPDDCDGVYFVTAEMAERDGYYHADTFVVH